MLSTDMWVHSSLRPLQLSKYEGEEQHLTRIEESQTASACLSLEKQFHCLLYLHLSDEVASLSSMIWKEHDIKQSMSWDMYVFSCKSTAHIKCEPSTVSTFEILPTTWWAAKAQHRQGATHWAATCDTFYYNWLVEPHIIIPAFKLTLMLAISVMKINIISHCSTCRADTDSMIGCCSRLIVRHNTRNNYCLINNNNALFEYYFIKFNQVQRVTWHAVLLDVSVCSVIFFVLCLFVVSFDHFIIHMFGSISPSLRISQ